MKIEFEIEITGDKKEALKIINKELNNSYIQRDSVIVNFIKNSIKLKDNPVPSLDLLKEEIYQEFLDETMWQNKHFKKKLDKIFSRYQNGVETNKEQPKRYCTFCGKESNILYDLLSEKNGLGCPKCNGEYILGLMR
ncbi:MAG: hypothetical protein ACOCV1_04165 [Bacillota bacterium]